VRDTIFGNLYLADAGTNGATQLPGGVTCPGQHTRYVG
jgi:hypothetical protein